jgi:hypothetical protein
VLDERRGLSLTPGPRHHPPPCSLFLYKMPPQLFIYFVPKKHKYSKKPANSIDEKKTQHAGIITMLLQKLCKFEYIHVHRDLC